MLLLTLFAFTPREQALPSGPPTAHLDRRPAVQWRLSSQPRWIDFQSRWGGEWYVRWDERNATPRFVGAPGVDGGFALLLVEDLAALSGVDPAELTLSKVTERGERRILQWTRHWQGAPVEGDQIAVVETRGRIGAIWVRLTPTAGLPAPRAGEHVLNIDGRPVLARRSEDARAVTWTGRAGQIVQRYDPRYYATVQVSCEERTVGDAFLTAPAIEVSVSDTSGGAEYTDVDGTCSLSGALTATLNGPHLRVTDASAAVSVSGTDDFTMTGGEDLSKAAASVQHHTHVVRSWLEERWPTHTWLPEQILADVNQATGTCNAYYTGGTINFLLPGSCNNLGQIADVIYHEYGHGVHDYILAAGTFASDVSEGSADFVSATILDDPNVAPEFAPGWSYLRELDTDKFYPDDVIGESHNDGLIWGSFVWNLREQWVEDYGEEEGVEMTDLLFLGALEQGPELTDLYEAVLTADDDDGDWSNGTPHDCELIELLDYHGLGPGVLGFYQLEWSTIEPQASATDGYPIEFYVYTLSADCGLGDAPTGSVWYSTSDDARPPIGTAGWEDWTELSLSSTGSTWSGELPRIPANARMRWFIALTSSDGTETETSYEVPDNISSFWVGDREEVWCDDLEGDVSEWTSQAGSPWLPTSSSTWTNTWVFGTPGGGTWKPDAAWSGSVAAMTGLVDDYPASNYQSLVSPDVTVPDGLMRLLSYRRWLTVEDGYYDQALLWALTSETFGEPLWANPRTDGGVTAFLDTDWTNHDASLEGVLDGEGTLSFGWSIQSDGGLEFGGWALDDVCVVTLADVPGHYRVDDLVGQRVGTAVNLSWSVPWITPIAQAVLVKKEGSWPTGPTDGVVLGTVDDPVWGEVHTAADTVPLDSAAVYYAVFVAGESEEDWYSEVVLGENGYTLGGTMPDDLIRPVEDEEVDTGETGETGELEETGDPAASGDTGDPTEAPGAGEETGSPKPDGCACATTEPGSGRGWALLVGLVGALGLRRRRG